MNQIERNKRERIFNINDNNKKNCVVVSSIQSKSISEEQ